MIFDARLLLSLPYMVWICFNASHDHWQIHLLFISFCSVLLVSAWAEGNSDNISGLGTGTTHLI